MTVQPHGQNAQAKIGEASTVGYPHKKVTRRQARNQLGTPGGARSFLRVVQIF